MRKGFTLIELLVVVTILPFIMIALSGVYVTLIRDIPRTTRVLQENTTVLDWLGQMRRDVEGAVGLPEQFEGEHADERTLLIEQPGQVIRYRIEDGRIARTVLRGGISEDKGQRTAETSASNPPSGERLWRIPDAVFAWRLWERDGRAYAIEVHSYVKQLFNGLLRKKLANSQVFFIHAFPGEGQAR